MELSKFAYVASCPHCEEVVMAVLDTDPDATTLSQEYTSKGYAVEKISLDKYKIVMGKCTCIHKGD